MSKYGNKKTVVDGITFDSKKEANRYCQLKMLERAREISQLELQHEFELIPRQAKGEGIRSERACKYRADFYYVTKDGNQIVEDVKGKRTKDYIIKRKLMKYRYGIDVVEV